MSRIRYSRKSLHFPQRLPAQAFALQHQFVQEKVRPACIVRIPSMLSAPAKAEGFVEAVCRGVAGQGIQPHSPFSRSPAPPDDLPCGRWRLDRVGLPVQNPVLLPESTSCGCGVLQSRLSPFCKLEFVPIRFFWNKGLLLCQTQALKYPLTQTRWLRKKLWRDSFP